jgi:serine/threonine protein kinase/serine/threonine protein phosphatase PrpC
MSRELSLSIGQYSDKGRKDANQDFHGALIPDGPVLGAKGITIAIADGISTSSVGGIAAQSAIKSFLTDCYCTSDAWSVKTSAQRVIAATNSWLYSQTRRSANPYDADRGYVCTLSVVVVKSTTAHIPHVGDARIYRVAGRSLEQITEDRRIVISPQQCYLGRALGVKEQVEIDYRAVPVSKGDIFVMTTDGVHEYVDAGFVTKALADNAGDLDHAASAIAAEAFQRGSDDILTVQIVRVDELPAGEAGEVFGQVGELPLPPMLEARMVFDNYTILRQIHASSRSHIFLAEDVDTKDIVALKIPSIDLREDPAYLGRFAMEEWVARRIDDAHVVKAPPPTRKRNYLYIVTEYIDGQTLAQWMIDNPRPDLESVRGIVEQIAKGLRAFHRKEMLHQDLRPQNIMIGKAGTVKLIDFGSVRVAGVSEAANVPGDGEILGTAQYTAPEYFLGDGGTTRSDLFSLGVIAYQLLTGQLPYGVKVARTRTKSQQRRLTYASATIANPNVPVWIDRTLRKAVDPDPQQRYEALSEFVFDLRNPKDAFLSASRPPLLERNPVRFWQFISLMLAIVVVLALVSTALADVVLVRWFSDEQPRPQFFLACIETNCPSEAAQGTGSIIES